MNFNIIRLENVYTYIAFHDRILLNLGTDTRITVIINQISTITFSPESEGR